MSDVEGGVIRTIVSIVSDESFPILMTTAVGPLLVISSRGAATLSLFRRSRAGSGKGVTGRWNAFYVCTYSVVCILSIADEGIERGGLREILESAV